MRLKITHTTRYAYDAPVPSGLQQVRMTPKQSTGQRVLAWDMVVTGGTRELSFEDAHRNRVDLISFTRHARADPDLHGRGRDDRDPRRRGPAGRVHAALDVSCAPRR